MQARFIPHCIHALCLRRYSDLPTESLPPPSFLSFFPFRSLQRSLETPASGLSMVLIRTLEPRSPAITICRLVAAERLQRLVRCGSRTTTRQIPGFAPFTTMRCDLAYHYRPSEVTSRRALHVGTHLCVWQPHLVTDYENLTKHVERLRSAINDCCESPNDGFFHPGEMSLRTHFGKLPRAGLEYIAKPR